MDAFFSLFSDPAVWAALITLIVMEVVLGIDNLIFISILTNKLPEHQRSGARRIGIGLALGLRLLLLTTIAFIVGMTAPLFDLGLQGALDSHGAPSFETAFSWRDIILIAGGLFLCGKRPRKSTTPSIRNRQRTCWTRKRARRPWWRISTPPSCRSCCSTWCSPSIPSSPPWA
jgi:predicted tellurium resistance membrane protein TerC